MKDRMRFQTKVVIALAVLLLPARAMFAADDLKSVLAQLNAAAARFRSASASFDADNEQTEPIPDKDVQTGMVYYQHAGNGFQVGIHIDKENSKPVPKIIVIKGGTFTMYEKLPNQVTTSQRAGKYEGYLGLGFGASGNDLESKWNVTYRGAETMNGVKVAKLDLVPKDPDVLKTFPKVTIWIDPERGVSLKQYFDEGQGQSRTVLYSNIKVNQSLPADAFSFKTDSKTQFVNR
jgi:outer membrane lipoprotein-sorting protein